MDRGLWMHRKPAGETQGSLGLLDPLVPVMKKGNRRMGSEQRETVNTFTDECGKCNDTRSDVVPEPEVSYNTFISRTLSNISLTAITAEDCQEHGVSPTKIKLFTVKRTRRVIRCQMAASCEVSPTSMCTLRHTI